MCHSSPNKIQFIWTNEQFEPKWYIIFGTIFNIHHLHFKCRFYTLDNVKWFVPHAYLNTKYQCNVFILLRGKSIRKKLNFWSTLPKVCLFSLIHHTVWDRYEIVNIIFLALFGYINCRDMFVLFGHHQSCPMCLKILYIFIISVVSFQVLQTALTNLSGKRFFFSLFTWISWWVLRQVYLRIAGTTLSPLIVSLYFRRTTCI